MKNHKKSSRIKRVLVGIGCLSIILLVSWFINNPEVVGASATKRELPIYCVERDDKVVSLTFDAAWGDDDTQELIDIFKKYNIRATFFLVGEWIDKFPDSTKALHDAGHELMSHSDDHAHLSKLTNAQIVDNINRNCDKIEAITGYRPILLRCPYGEYDDHVISTVKSMGITSIQWDVDSLDWKGLTAEEITNRVVTRVNPGSIILFHNDAGHTPEALPGIIEALIADGYSFTPVSELLLDEDYIIDHTGKQCALR